MRNGINLQRKKRTVAFYVLVFCVAVPVAVLFSSMGLDARFQFQAITGFSTLGAILLCLSLVLFASSIVVYMRNTKELPISAFPPPNIIRNGPYSVLRHPIYLSFTIILIGISLIWGSRSMLTIVIPVFIVFESLYIRSEERHLVERFGPDYEAYREQTSHIIPRFHVLLKIPLFVLSRLFFPTRVVNSHNIPKKAPFLLVASHRNYLDPLIIMSALPYKVHFVTTFEMFRNPVVAFVFRALGCIPKRRYLPDLHTVQEVESIIAKGGIVGIFPEGERSLTGKLLSMKIEAMKLLKKHSDLEILPVAISGNYFVWPRWGREWRKCEVTVDYKPTILLRQDQSLDDIAQRISSLITPDDKGKNCYHRRKAYNIQLVLYRCPVCREFDSFQPNDNRFCCRHCSTVFLLDDDYTITGTSGDALTTIHQFYQAIRINNSDLQPRLADAPVTTEEGSTAMIAESKLCELSIERGFSLCRLLEGRLLLLADRLDVVGDDLRTVTIALKDVLAATIEGARKLQIYDKRKGQLYQLVFTKEAARKWQDYIAEACYACTGVYPILR